MARFTQKTKFLQIKSSLGEDDLILQGMTGEEALNELYRFRVDAISPRETIAPTTILNQRVSIRLTSPESDTVRYFHGIVATFSQYGIARNFVTADDYWRYRFDVVPAMWRLTQRTECRIFQNKTTKEVVETVLQENAVSDFVWTAGPGREWETCVQYMESDFAFVSRLLEEEGIFYFHKHSESKHELTIIDNPNSYVAITGGPAVYLGHRESQTHVVEGWELEQRILPTEWETADFSYHKVDQSSAKPGTVLPQPAGKLSIFDYPGGHMDTGDQDKRAKNRMQSIEAGGVVANGHGACRFFTAGAHFELKDHYAPGEEGKKWVCARVHHVAKEASELSGEKDPPVYSNSFTCAPRDTALKSPRKTPRPVIAGTQTAIVTTAEGSMDGPTDGGPAGRVKVMFHWVAKGRGRGSGESCWVRVAQPFAGPKFGFQYIPQVDDEVIVAFMDGDPDHPMIIGSIHNGKNPYPWDVPANWTQSGFRSRAKAGGKYSGETSNVLRFEDKGGSEEIWTHAAKNQRREVTNDDRSDVGHDQTQDVVNNRTRTVGMDEKVTIGMTQHVKAGTKITLECGQSKITMDPMSIKIKSMMITIKASLTLDEEGLFTTVKGNAFLTLKGGMIFIN